MNESDAVSVLKGCVAVKDVDFGYARRDVSFFDKKGKEVGYTGGGYLIINQDYSKPFTLRAEHDMPVYAKMDSYRFKSDTNLANLGTLTFRDGSDKATLATGFSVSELEVMDGHGESVKIVSEKIKEKYEAKAKNNESGVVFACGADNSKNGVYQEPKAFGPEVVPLSNNTTQAYYQAMLRNGNGR